eukprot:EG_transcript_15161
MTESWHCSRRPGKTTRRQRRRRRVLTQTTAKFVVLCSATAALAFGRRTAEGNLCLRRLSPVKSHAMPYEAGQRFMPHAAVRFRSGIAANRRIGKYTSTPMRWDHHQEPKGRVSLLKGDTGEEEGVTATERRSGVVGCGNTTHQKKGSSWGRLCWWSTPADIPQIKFAEVVDALQCLEGPQR